MSTINIGISDLNIAKPPNILATYALGSCIGICLHDKVRNIGGLVHIMLPDSHESTKASDNPRRYADTGIAELVQRHRIQVDDLLHAEFLALRDHDSVALDLVLAEAK